MPYHDVYKEKLDELCRDCLLSGVCPICENNMKEISESPNASEFICKKDNFHIYKTYFSFNINNNFYSYYYGLYYGTYIYHKAQKLFNIKDMTENVDSLTLAKIYDNLNKYLVFK